MPGPGLPGRQPDHGLHLPLVDLIKACASQLIVLHHLAFYGPMSDSARPLAPAVFDWFSDYARVAVACFLAVAGFLAARSIRLDKLAPGMIGRRFWRLAKPYWVALLLAIAAAALARAIEPHEEIPAWPSLMQFVANALLVQDLLGFESLSAGFWYVAIDFQLYALLIVLLLVLRRVVDRPWRALAAAAAIAALTAASLLWFNRDPKWDAWAPYFFGAYGMGVLAAWLLTPAAWLRPALRNAGIAFLCGLPLIAIWTDYRPRIAVAALTALALLFSPRLDRFARRVLPGLSMRLARSSYSLLLVHFSVCIVVGALFARYAPNQSGAHALGIVSAWLLSNLAAAMLHRLTEARAPRASAMLTR